MIELPYKSKFVSPFDWMELQQELWRIVEYDGKFWRVYPKMLGPIAIGDAEPFCQSVGAQLPSVGLVDAIYKKADIWLDPILRSHDNTSKTMASPEMYASQHEKLQKLLEQECWGPLALVVGTHKDIVLDNGGVGLYAWKWKDGKNQQQLYKKHHLGWIDYSQGVRPVRPL